MTFAKSKARQGVDWLLATNPHLDVVEVEWQGRASQSEGLPGPWVLVKLGQRSAGEGGADVFAVHPYAVFKRTGAVHGMEGGAVLDPPLFTP